MIRPHTSPQPTPAATLPLTLWGEVAEPLSLTVADLRAGWERRRAEVVFDCATAGPRHHTFAGPLLREVVAAVRPRFDPARRKERSRFPLAVSGGEGHHTVLSWAEIDADFGDAPVLLATRMDDREPDGAGPRLVVPSDRCGARYVSAVTGVRNGRHLLGGTPPSEA
ncbi:hypothetical protein GCM10010363_39800 [Streptomyces omiyaensis]|uniref:molybdopterin-dependent oxidoreductase n=1 Tax=Streptomyces omiyaensis TaxID=68247 RepID=UPI0016796740|nr:molybdopterin-dependent oxidoreductase [Streptomyces omiyaensis]GGY54591.1 hypothetical protein GCM10010363_39800 [Streptomyces omiyaensis]